MAFKLSGLVISLLFFSGIILGLSSFQLDLNNSFDKSTRDLTSMNVTEDIRQISKDTQDAMGRDIFVGIPIISDIINFFYKGIIAVWNSMHIMMGSVALTQNVINETAVTLSLPGWAFGIGFTIVLLVAVFALAAVILKSEV